jgi:hypothetical protein
MVITVLAIIFWSSRYEIKGVEKMTNIGVEFVNFFTSFMELQPAAVLGCKRHIHIFYLPLKL